MAASLSIISGSGSLGSLVDWEIQDDATPSAVGIGAGDVGSIDLTAGRTDRSRFLGQNQCVLNEPDMGNFAFTVSGVDSLDKTTVAVSGSGLLGALNITVTAPPIFGSSVLQDAFTTYIGLAYGATPPTISYIASTNPVVALPGWTDNLWDVINDLAAVYGVEMALINGIIVIRDVGGRPLAVPNITEVVFSDQPDDLALYVQCNYGQARSVTAGGVIWNYSTNPSVETNATGWIASVGGSTTLNSQGRALGLAASGSYSYQANFTGSVTYNPRTGLPSNTGTVTCVHTFPVPPLGVELTMSITVKYSGTSATATPTINWYDANGNLIAGTTVQGVAGVVVPAGVRVFVKSTPPPNAATGKLSTSVTAVGPGGTTPTPVTGVIGWDAVLVSSSGSTSYFDGSTPGIGAGWGGLTNNSISSYVPVGSTAFYDAYADNNNVITVETGATSTGVLTARGTVSTIFQPLYASTTPTRATPIGIGRYLVSGGNPLLPIPAAQWAAYGGSLTIEPGDNPNELKYTLVGPKADIPDNPGPYSMAYSDGSNEYATLSIMATGTYLTPASVIIDTGADPDLTQNKDPIVIDSQMVQTVDQAYDQATKLARLHSGACPRISFTLSHADALGFGLTVGSIVSVNDGLWRICAAPATVMGVTCSAELRVLDSDMFAQWGASPTAYEAFWQGQIDPNTGAAFQWTDSDVTAAPLWH